MRYFPLIALLLFWGCEPKSNEKSAEETKSSTNPFIMVLGIAQDAGYPHIGCERECCMDVQNPEKVSSLGLVDPESGKRWIFDATPDFPAQIRMMDEWKKSDQLLTGVFLTHAHIGHYTGLMYLGREAIHADSIQVYAMPRMKMFLENNGPWDQLVNLENIAIEGITSGDTVKLTKELFVVPFSVPHRDEYSETVGYIIGSKKKSVAFIPDIDKWNKWGHSLENLVRSCDHVFIDGTFFRNGEIKGRDMSEIPHPFMEETMTLLDSLPLEQRNKVVFIHFNHTNPAIHSRAKVEDLLSKKGYGLAKEGMKIELD